MPGLLLIVASIPFVQDVTPLKRWWDQKVETSLERAPERKADWERILETIKPEQRSGVAYLLVDLPIRDLQTLSPGILRQNVSLAYLARAEVPWGPTLPEPIFLDAVLPYVSVTERREAMRAQFLERYLPAVKKCNGPGEAALAINKTLFKDYRVDRKSVV